MYQDLSEFKCKPLPPPFPGFVMVCLKIGYKNDQLLHALKISSCRANRWKRRKKPMDKPMDNGSVSFIEYPWNDDFWGIGGMHFPTHPYIATWIQKSHKNSGGTHRCPKIFRQSRSTSLHVYSICFFIYVFICFGAAGDGDGSLAWSKLMPCQLGWWPLGPRNLHPSKKMAHRNSRTAGGRAASDDNVSSAAAGIHENPDIAYI